MQEGCYMITHCRFRNVLHTYDFDRLYRVMRQKRCPMDAIDAEQQDTPDTGSHYHAQIATSLAQWPASAWLVAFGRVR